MGDGKQVYEPPQPIEVKAVMACHGDFYLWQVDGGLWHWHEGCAKVAAAGFLETVCQQLVSVPEGGYRVCLRGNGPAWALIVEASKGVHSSRPYPRLPSYVSGAAIWALARNGISFGFIEAVGKVKVTMAKSQKKIEAGPEALPSSAQRGSLVITFHDVLMFECEYSTLNGAARINIQKSHVTGSLEALLSKVAAVIAPILKGDTSGAVTQDDSNEGLETLSMESIVDDLAPTPLGAPKTTHTGEVAKLPEAAKRLEQVTPDQQAAAAQVDAIASAINQSADGGDGTDVDELPFDPMGGLPTLESLQDLGSDVAADHTMVEVDDTKLQELQPLGNVLPDEGEDEVETLSADTDATELAVGISGQVATQDIVDVQTKATSGVVPDDTEIEVEIVELEETQPIGSLSSADGSQDGSADVEGDSGQTAAAAAQAVVGSVNPAELDDIPEPVGSPRADKKTKEAIQTAASTSTATNTQKAAAKAARGTQGEVPQAKEPAVATPQPSQGEVPGIRVPTPAELKGYVGQLKPENQAKVVKIRDDMATNFDTLEKLDPSGKQIDPNWAVNRQKFVGKDVKLVHRFLLGAYIARLYQKEQKEAKAKA